MLNREEQKRKNVEAIRKCIQQIRIQNQNSEKVLRKLK